jgi:hypothetical protein
LGKRVSGRPWAVASLLLPWLAFAAQAQTNAAEPVERDGSATSAVAATADPAAPLDGWALLACDASQRTAVLRRPDGELVLVREGDRFPPASPPGLDPHATETVPVAAVRQVLADRVTIDLPIPSADGPDAAWIHVAAADGTSRVQYLRRRALPPDIHEYPPPSSDPGEGARRSTPRRPE